MIRERPERVECLTFGEAHAICQINREDLRAAISNEELACITEYGRMYIPVASLVAWRREKRRKARPKA